MVGSVARAAAVASAARDPSRGMRGTRPGLPGAVLRGAAIPPPAEFEPAPALLSGAARAHRAAVCRQHGSTFQALTSLVVRE